MSVSSSIFIDLYLHLPYLWVLEVLGRPQVNHDNALTVLRPEHVFRFDVPMDDAESVQFCNALAHFVKRVLGQGWRDEAERAALLPHFKLLVLNLCDEVQVTHILERVQQTYCR